MLLTNTYAEFKKLIAIEGKHYQEIASELGLVPNAITNRIKGQVVNKGYIEIVDALGYDIEIVYKKKG